jgi:uncharacterized membrane protein
MSAYSPRWPFVLVLIGSLLGLVFAGYSTIDYVNHLDRQVHDIHCSIVPGAAAEESLESGCRVALYSPYSALLRDRIWGGVPVSLFAVGAFSFFIAFAIYLLVAGPRAPRRAIWFLGATSVTPLLVSIVMAVISAVKLGTFCQTCIGIYASSVLLATGGVAAWLIDRRRRRHEAFRKPPRAGSDVPPTVVDNAEGLPPRPLGASWLAPAWLLALGLFAIAPGGLYLHSVPSYGKYVGDCGDLKSVDDPKQALLRITPRGAEQPVVLMVDPLCPTCKAFHQRLVAEGVFSKLDTTLVLFPLDSECNWMLTTPLHPGACTVARAVLCGESRALDTLEWAYENQDELLAAARTREGNERVKALINGRFSGMNVCIEDKRTKQKLDENMRFAVQNQLPVSTPQLFVGSTRLCDEDLDIGLPYALRKLSPVLAKR